MHVQMSMTHKRLARAAQSEAHTRRAIAVPAPKNKVIIPETEIREHQPVPGKTTFISGFAMFESKGNGKRAAFVPTYQPMSDKMPRGTPPSELATINKDNSTSYFEYGNNRWSVVSPSHHTTTLDILSKSCHSVRDLVTNKYRLTATEDQDFEFTPPVRAQTPKRKAVVLDCEMVQVVGEMRELAFVCAIDYLTGEILISSFVRPGKMVTDWRSEYSRITEEAMNSALAAGTFLDGWKAARMELFRFIDANTILVGHALNHDLDVLRLLHLRIVDSSILTRNAIGSSGKLWGLKALCDELLDVEIQNHAGKGHDCLEDTLGARELVLWLCGNTQGLKRWAAEAARQEKEKAAERKKVQHRGRHGRGVGNRKNRRGSGEAAGGRRQRGSEDRYQSYLYDEDRVLNWADMVDYCGWPNSDMGYYGWSD